jgi:uncharacterized Zn finger protein (UPF0148 family)
MSEDFDKEAERERLREKYEADREDREATERMSELLLQGATMTNQHCNTCGSPIFRYQGQEFCPTCQAERGQAASTEGEGQGQQGGAQQGASGAAQEGAAGATETDQATGAGGAETEQPTGAGEPAPSPAETPEAARTPAQSQDAGRTQAQPQDAGTAPTQPGPVAASSSGQAGAGSLDEARATLVRTITTLARRAEQTDDPRQAKELLAAAREAAETLSRLRGN